MEKELILYHGQLTLCFLYEEFELESNQLEIFKSSLTRALPAFENFLKNKMQITQQVDLNLSLVGDETIKDINKEHRQKDKITDVLSFPLQDNIRNGEYDKLFPELQLGDLFICDSVCKAQAIEFKITYEEELLHLLTHGFLHVLGYDHEINEEEEKLMESLEKEILDQIADTKA